MTQCASVIWIAGLRLLTMMTKVEDNVDNCLIWCIVMLNEQSTQPTALNALLMMAHFHGVAASGSDIMHRFSESGKDLTQEEWLLAAKSLGLKARVVKQSIERLPFLALPVMVWCEDGQHFIIAKMEKHHYLIHDFQDNKPKVVAFDLLAKRFSGRVILVASRASVLGSLAKFDFTWFIPAVIKYRRLFLEVLLASIVVQLFALITPLFFQVVMDKVLVHRGFSTLNVITVAFIVVALFDVVLNGLRTYLFSHTTSRIDVELGARLFRHMLQLPIAYFEQRRVGETVARVRELENIRQFLTGQALTSVLDLLFSFVFIMVMWLYSPSLALIVMASLPLYAAWSAVISPILRNRLQDKFARYADNQSFLVESVSALGTIKAMAVEPQMIRRWDKQLAAYVQTSFRVTKIATIGQQGIQFIQKGVSIATLYFGAKLVIEGKMTVGQLVAFNMLAGQVAAPVIRLAQLWQDFQQVGISVARLGDILNTPTENPNSRLNLPAIHGDIRFEGVRFRYRADGQMILPYFSLRINAGEVVGIVGRSGSGKSTLTKLIQRLYLPEQGKIFIDGHDIALVDPAWLRRQIGVVLQENVLMNASIRDNIALSDPAMDLERIMAAAKLAGAHEFITALPEGYDTIVGEQGAGLSGGQRQRIAIARALVNNPRILILDEATSALDYESEHAIMRNMAAICHQRTVIIIAHRLSTVRHANRIIAMDKGEIVEMGTHDELLARPEGYYRYLHQLQNHF